jgi:hypothetical protein
VRYLGRCTCILANYILFISVDSRLARCIVVRIVRIDYHWPVAAGTRNMGLSIEHHSAAAIDDAPTLRCPQRAPNAVKVDACLLYDDAHCGFDGWDATAKILWSCCTFEQPTQRIPCTKVIMSSQGERAPLLQQRWSEEGEPRTVRFPSHASCVCLLTCDSIFVSKTSRMRKTRENGRDGGRWPTWPS